MTSAVSLDTAEPPENLPVLPEFQLLAFDAGSGDVELQIGTPVHPSISRPASQALLYGLAILMLDQMGVLSRMIDEELLADGPINEIDAVNRITLLLNQDANVQLA
jgi:hypothetical protein